MASLYIFSASYPFGAKETYLEEEVQILSEYFNIIIQPHYYNNKDTSLREVPNNVTVCKPALPLLKSKRLFQCLIGLLRKPQLFLFFIDFIKNGDFLSLDHLKRFILTLIDYLATLGSTQYKSISKLKNQKLYFYWGFGWSYMTLNFNQAKNCTSYIRLHGSEVYLERSNGYIPLRKQLFQKSDFLLPISNNLAAYLKTRYDVLSEKIKVSRLGVFMPNDLTDDKGVDSNEMHLVSCSNMIKLKRIDMIVESLKAFEGTPVKWVHFGDGPEMNTIKEQINASNFKTIKVELIGRKPNAEVLDYYKNNHVDAFVNVSKHEGVPVSAMEAMSCKIPCIASNVGATAELVNNENGILLEEDFSIDDLIKSLQEVRKNEQWNPKREISYSYCDQFFNAEKNYEQLSETLKNN